MSSENVCNYIPQLSYWVRRSVAINILIFCNSIQLERIAARPPKAPEPEMLHWKTVKAGAEGTTARIEVNVKARIGSYVQPPMHDKAMLVGQPAPDKLEIEISTDTSSICACHTRLLPAQIL